MRVRSDGFSTCVRATKVCGAPFGTRVTSRENMMDEQRYSANLPQRRPRLDFFRSPVCEDFSKIDADIAFLGIPTTAASASGRARALDLREIRSFSVRYSAWGGHKAERLLGRQPAEALPRRREHGRLRRRRHHLLRLRHQPAQDHRRASRRSCDRGAFPVLIGGDHSVTFPNVCAFSRFGPVDIVHIDAHMDWRDEIDGVRYANASPLRRSKELPFVRNMVQLGIRDIRTSDDQIADARRPARKSTRARTSARWASTPSSSSCRSSATRS